MLLSEVSKGRENNLNFIRFISAILVIYSHSFPFSLGDGNSDILSAFSKGEMTFGGVASTRRMCPDIELETRFTQVLESVTHYEVDGDMLLLLSKGELRAVLQAVSKE